MASLPGTDISVNTGEFKPNSSKKTFYVKKCVRARICSLGRFPLTVLTGHRQQYMPEICFNLVLSRSTPTAVMLRWMVPRPCYEGSRIGSCLYETLHSNNWPKSFRWSALQVQGSGPWERGIKSLSVQSNIFCRDRWRLDPCSLMGGSCGKNGEYSIVACWCL